MSNILVPCPACGRELKLRDRKLLGKRGKCPSCQHLFVLEEPVTLQLADTESPLAAIGPRWVADQKPIAGITSLPIAETVTGSPPGIARIRGLRKQKGVSRWIGVAAAVMVVVVAGGIAYTLLTSPQPASDGPARRSDGFNAASSTNPGSHDDGRQATLAARPTHGKPIPLEMIPAGARLLVHLRPADLWRPDGPGEEFRFCLGPLGEFVEGQITSLCKFPPEQIDEVLFAWIPGPRGTAPDFAYIVRLKNEAKKSELLDAVGGERDDSYGRPVYISNDRVGVIADLKTFAMGPASLAEEMATSIGGVNPLPNGVEGLMPLSDRTRHITVLFEPTAVLLDEEFLVPANVRPFLRTAMDWFGDDAETVLWSLHLERDRFYSDVSVRNQTGVRPIALQERMRERLDQLPKELFTAVRSMNPQELGKRKVIGRMPAMSKVVAMATEVKHGSRHVQLITPLPDRAAPSLALGTLLAWDESTRTDFSKQPATRPGDSGGLPASIADRLKKKIDVDFRREPLQGAIEFIAEETKVKFEIDGDALKLAGYTQNMPQTFKLDQVAATTAILTIFQQPKQEQLCLVVDEQKKIAQITTHAVAEQQGLKPFPLKQ